MKVMVRNYSNARDYERDAPRQARKGFEPTLVVTDQREHRPKGLSIVLVLMTGGLALLFRAPRKIQVTYRCGTCH